MVTRLIHSVRRRSLS